MLSEENQANAEEILYAISHIEEYMQQADTLEAFKSNTMLYDAVMMNFILIGEACKRLDMEVKTANPQIDWKGINGYRNFIAHEYFGVDENIVWAAITLELPVLKAEIQKLLR